MSKFKRSLAFMTVPAVLALGSLSYGSVVAFGAASPSFIRGLLTRTTLTETTQTNTGRGAVLELFATLTIFGGTGNNGPIGLLPLILGASMRSGCRGG